MNESGDRAVTVFTERVVCLTRHSDEFSSGGDNGFAEGLQGIFRIQQTHVIRCHRSGQERAATGEAVAFFDGQIENSFELLDRKSTRLNSSH